MTFVWSSLDTWIAVTGAACAMACAVLGNFLVLRKASLMGDAISHALLPGIVVAFLLTGSRASLPMFVGAAIAGVLTAWASEWLRGRGKVDAGASMGIVFTSLFALGLVLLNRYARNVDLDVDCVLNGLMELSVGEDLLVGKAVPRVFVTLSIVFAINLGVVVLLYKELKISSFDPQLATTLGINATAMHYLLMSLTAITTVAAFEAVGPILVIAMLIVPAAAAYLLTDRLPLMIVFSLVIAAASAFLGHLGAMTLPRLAGFDTPTTTAGMMASAAGGLFVLVMFASPQHGLVARVLRRRLLANRILYEDVLAMLYRGEERGQRVTSESLQHDCGCTRWNLSLALWRLKRRKRVVTNGIEVALTPTGRRVAKRLVRSHRLWEQFLAERTTVATDHVHSTAERLEHVTDERLRLKLATQTSGRQDPHGQRIPEEGTLDA